MAAYEESAAAYAAARVPTGHVAELEEFVGRLPSHARVLEIGSGSGQDARWLEEHGLRVRRTDITRAFVEMLRADGYEADHLDPLTDELVPAGAEPYDAVWSNASLLHLRRDHLPLVLVRLRAAVNHHGLMFVSLKEGDGESWSTHGSIAAPRFFTYWREEPLREILTVTGWEVEELRHRRGPRDDWLAVIARATQPA